MSVEKTITQEKLFVKCNIDTIAYNSKPSGSDAAVIVPRLKNKTRIQNIWVRGLCKKISEGYSFTPAVMNGTKDSDWVEQQVFAVDIDNKNENAPLLTMDECEDLLSTYGLDYTFMYDSFQSTEEHPRFRIILVCEETIVEPSEALKMNQALVALFSQADSSCTNLGRFYYGTKKKCHEERYHQRTFKKARLLELYAQKVKATDEPKIAQNPAPLPAKIPHTASHGVFDLGTAIEKYNLLEYIESTRGVVGKRRGKDVLINPCPICGHNDDFYVDTEKNVFRCHGANGDVGGNIITYLEIMELMTRPEARDYFKYTLCGVDKDKEQQEWRDKREQEIIESIEAECAGEVVALPKYVVQKIDSKGNVKVSISCPLLAQHIRENVSYFYVKDSAKGGTNRFWYKDGVYQLVSDEMVKGCIKSLIPLEYQRMQDVNEVFHLLATDMHFVEDSQLNSNENIINFQNGFLHLDTMELHPHDPNIFSTVQIPCNWNPEAKGQVFDRFMEHLTEGDAEKRSLVLQFMGATLSNIKGYRFKKSAWLVGKGDTGKSQVKAALEMLVGRSNTSSIDLAELESRFGPAGIYGKRLAGSGDMSFISVNEMKVFKKATGGDQLYAEYKGENSFYFTYNGLFLFCCNELPKFGGDRGDWVYDRIMVIECNNVVPKEKRDKHLQDKFFAEREYIAYIAVKELKKSIANGYEFIVGQKSEKALARYKISNSSIQTFFHDCCTFVPEGAKNPLSKKDLYNVYRDWMKDNSRGFYESNQQFKKELEAIGVGMIKRTSKNECYWCIELNETGMEYHTPF